MKKKVKKIIKKSKEIKEMTTQEILFNVPTFLNLARILLTFVVAYMIITGQDIIFTVGVFVVAALTDWFDGRIARKYHLVNSFGAKADMVADRFLWIGTALVLAIAFGMGENSN